ncbi:aminotransferase-like domain-containing protein [Paenibacillus xylanexedens]|uniref:aminotransferase-like domain-containing protein n=1 Tax=Paenibacillus xylanexedens TaxID=528191 RepID=UPI0011A866CF|nr:PLP-dependent aminotransferase family protein [Paenibacillus xylanexedens]
MTSHVQPFQFPKRVPDAPPVGAAQASTRSDVIPLSYGTPSSEAFPYTELQAAATAAILQEGQDALQYAGSLGPTRVQQWITERAALRSIHVGQGRVLVTYGSQQAIDFAARALLEPGDHVWVEAPTYFGAVSTFKTAEAVITSFPLDEDGIQVDQVEAALQEAVQQGKPLPKLLYCMPNFHNPGGVSLSIERREHLARLAYEYNFFILEDDAYAELVYEGQHLPAIYSFGPERVIYLSSFSKIIAPGIRLGWAIGSPTVIRHMNSFFQGSKASVFSQEIVAQLFNHLPFNEHLDQLITRYRASRDVMVTTLREQFGDEVQFQIPDGGFFIWLTFPTNVRTSEFVKTAADLGVSFLPGSQFFVTPEGEQHARLSFSYCNAEDIQQGVIRFAEAYRNYKNRTQQHY